MDRRVRDVMRKLREQELPPPGNSQATTHKIIPSAKQKMTIEELARQVGLSETRLCAIFKSELGLTPRQFAKQARMEGAALLVTGTYWKVTEIAAKLEVDESHFVRDFKKAHGLTPTAYRRLHQKDEEDGDQEN
ncbi:MAG: helix-turn-helix domain-containing protein [Blastocatellales bacterium]